MISISEMIHFQEGKTPNNGRHLIEGGKESYCYQLALSVEKLVSQILSLSSSQVNILDIGIFNSRAILELREAIYSINNTKLIKLTGIDIQDTDIDREEILFLNGDLEDDEFLKYILSKINKESQDLILMNQVSYYIGDRLKVIKFILENILAVGGEFHFNLITKRFFVPTGFYHWQFIEALENLWNKSEGFIFIKDRIVDEASNVESLVYHFRKISENSEILMPSFRRSTRDLNGYCDSIYSFKS